MDLNLALAGARWRTSSYSGTNGGDCVQVALLGGTHWRTSSYSGDNGGDCVQVAAVPGAIALRDSKNPEGGALIVPPTAFRALTHHLTAQPAAPSAMTLAEDRADIQAAAQARAELAASAEPPIPWETAKADLGLA